MTICSEEFTDWNVKNPVNSNYYCKHHLYTRDPRVFKQEKHLHSEGGLPDHDGMRLVGSYHPREGNEVTALRIHYDEDPRVDFIIQLKHVLGKIGGAVKGGIVSERKTATERWKQMKAQVELREKQERARARKRAHKRSKRSATENLPQAAGKAKLQFDCCRESLKTPANEIGTTDQADFENSGEKENSTKGCANLGKNLLSDQKLPSLKEETFAEKSDICRESLQTLTGSIMTAFGGIHVTKFDDFDDFRGSENQLKGSAKIVRKRGSSEKLLTFKDPIKAANGSSAAAKSLPQKVLRASRRTYDAMKMLIWDTGCTHPIHNEPITGSKGVRETDLRDKVSIFQGFGQDEDMTMLSHQQATVTYPNGMVMKNSARMVGKVDALGNAWTARKGEENSRGYGTWIDNTRKRSYIIHGETGQKFELIDVENQPIVREPVVKTKAKGSFTTEGGYLVHKDREGKILAIEDNQGELLST